MVGEVVYPVVAAIAAVVTGAVFVGATVLHAVLCFLRALFLHKRNTASTATAATAAAAETGRQCRWWLEHRIKLPGLPHGCGTECVAVGDLDGASVIFVLFPGNPGNPGFYRHYMVLLHQLSTATSWGGGGTMACLAVGHLGHSVGSKLANGEV